MKNRTALIVFSKIVVSILVTVLIGGVVHAAETSSSLTDAELLQLVEKIASRIAPFTLAEVRSGLSADVPPPPPNLVGSSGMWFTQSKTRSEGGKNVTVIAQVYTNSTMLNVKIKIKQDGSDTSLGDILSGTANSDIKTSTLFQSPLVKSDPIGFSDVTLEDDGVITKYHRTAAGKWTVESSTAQ